MLQIVLQVLITSPVSPTGQFKKSLDSFYVTDSPLSVTNISQMAMFFILTSSANWSVK